MQQHSDYFEKAMCQYDNMPIVEEMQAQAQAKAKWIIDIGLLDFRQKNKDACGK